MSTLRRPTVLAAVLLAVAAAMAVAYALAGATLAAWIGERFAGPLMAVGQGKFSDPVAFVQNRLGEAVALGVLALVFIAIDVALWPRLAAWRSGGAWALGAAVAFAQLNALAWAAQDTTTFWLATWQGEDASYPLTPFTIKRQLAEEAGAAHQIVVLGNSQASAQVEEGLIAQALGDGVGVTELGYVGTEPFDLLLIQPRIAALRPDAAVVFLSELSFYRGAVGMRYSAFMASAGQADFDALGGGALGVPGLADARWYARVARAVPLFAVREPLVRRVLGTSVADIDQFHYDVDLIGDLDARADATVPLFTAPDASTAVFQKRALETFVQRSAAAGTDVVLLAGRVNPLVSDRLDPALRADFLRTLDGLAARYPTVTVVGDAAMPDPPAAAYHDLTHVSDAEKENGTREMLPALVPPLRASVRRHTR